MEILMDYNRLKIFTKVAELGSVTAAAQQLRRSQSAVSQQMQILEDELGLRLLERKGGRVFLSQHGQDIYAICQSRLGEIQDEIAKLKRETTMIEGHIRIGVLNDFGNDIDYGAMIGEFCQVYSSVSFTMIEGTSLGLEQAAIANEIDLSLQVYFHAPEMFVQYPVVKSKHSLYCSPDYEKRRGVLKTYKQILDAELIDLTNDFICLGTFYKKNAPKLAASLAHRVPNIAAPNHYLVRQLLCSGFGVAILPDYFVVEELRSGRLKRLMPNSKPVYAGLDLAHRTTKTLRLCESVFIDFVKSWEPKTNDKRL